MESGRQVDTELYRCLCVDFYPFIVQTTTNTVTFSYIEQDVVYKFTLFDLCHCILIFRLDIVVKHARAIIRQEKKMTNNLYLIYVKA